MKKVTVFYQWVFVWSCYTYFRCYERTCTISGSCVLLRNSITTSVQWGITQATLTQNFMAIGPIVLVWYIEMVIVKLLHIKITIYHSQIFRACRAFRHGVKHFMCNKVWNILTNNVLLRDEMPDMLKMCGTCRSREPTMSTPFGHDQQPAPNAVW
jgi:hypothetical protein